MKSYILPVVVFVGGVTLGLAIASVFIEEKLEKNWIPQYLEYGSGTGAILCEKFKGLESLPKESFEHGKSMGYWVKRETVALCKDGSRIERKVLQTY